MHSIDPEIIQRCKSGNAKAFEHIVEVYQSYVFNIALKMLNYVEEAEDAVQEVFIKVWNNIGQYDHAGSRFSTWLYSVTTKTCIDILRKRKPETGLDDISIDGDRFWGDEGRSIEDAEVVEIIKVISSSLSPLQKAVFVLRDLEGYSVNEVAEMTGLSGKQIKDNLYLARKVVKDKMKKYFGYE